MKTRNPVAKNNNEFNKPKTFRDRKTHAKDSGDYGDKPKHQPYRRDYHDPYGYDMWQEGEDDHDE
jgi:hypothetical protein